MKVELKLQVKIIIRPAYKGNGKLYATSGQRQIGMIIKDGNTHTITDYDTEQSAYIACINYLKQELKWQRLK